jgi:AcrR family transcriptional regulator
MMRKKSGKKPNGSSARNQSSKSQVVRPPLTKDAILAEAHRIVAADGHESLSLRILAKRVGVTAAALYAHVESKHDLLRTLADKEYQRRAAVFGEIATADPFERLKAISHLYVREAQEQPNLFRFLLQFPPIGAWDAPNDVTPGGNQAFIIPASAVEDGIAQGLLKDGDPYMMSIAIWTAVHGVASFILQGADFVDAMADELVDTVVGGMLAGLAANADARARISDIFGNAATRRRKRKRKRKRVSQKM